MPTSNQTLKAAAWFPAAGLLSAWRERRLVLRLAGREIEARYRGSLLGVIWLLLLPLLMLGVYTFAFAVVFRARWVEADGAAAGTGAFALYLFAGLSIYSVFAETVNRAPSLILENPTYVKRVVFPLEILPWVALCVSLFNFLVSFAVLLLFYPFVFGVPPLAMALLPLVLTPLLLVTLGLSWFLASVGVFLRDIRPVVGVLTTALLFLSPIFYPLSALSADVRGVIALNPLSGVLEQARALIFEGKPPNPISLMLGLGVGALVAWLGFAWFARTRKAFADVL